MLDLIKEGWVSHSETPPGMTMCSLPYKFTYKQRQILQKKLADMLEMGVIEEPYSGWYGLLVFVVKRGFCRVLCRLAQGKCGVTVWCVSHTPGWQTAQFSTILDLTKYHWQIPLSPESKEKTAFSTPYGCVWSHGHIPVLLGPGDAAAHCISCCLPGWCYHSQ